MQDDREDSPIRLRWVLRQSDPIWRRLYDCARYTDRVRYIDKPFIWFEEYNETLVQEWCLDHGVGEWSTSTTMGYIGFKFAMEADMVACAMVFHHIRFVVVRGMDGPSWDREWEPA